MNLEQITTAEATRAIWAAKVTAALADQTTVGNMLADIAAKPLVAVRMTIAPTTGASAECIINYTGEQKPTKYETFTPDLYVRNTPGQVAFDMPAGMGFLNEVLYAGAIVAAGRLAFRIAQLEAEGVAAGYINNEL